jgi:AcrR family transcriptional regulator
VPYRRTPAVQARLDAQHASLVEAATQLLAEGGYAACTVAAVAARAGVAAGTVYRHFDSKAALAAEVFRRVVDREADAVASAISVEHTAAARTETLVRTFAGRALASPRLAYALLAEPVDQVVDELRLAYRSRFRAQIAQIIAVGIATGELPPQNESVVAAALVGAIGEALVGPLAGPLALDRDSRAAQADPGPDTVSSVVTLALRAIGAVHAAYA